MKRTKVKAAIKAAGGRRQLAELIGYSRGRIYQWESETDEEGKLKFEYLPELAERRWQEVRPR